MRRSHTIKAIHNTDSPDTRAHTHARTHPLTHSRTHAHTHAQPFTLNYVVPVRAFENHCHVIYVNQFAPPFLGQSVAVDPTGPLVADTYTRTSQTSS